MEYSRKLTLTLSLVFAMAATVVTAQDSPSDYLTPHNAARDAVGVAAVTWNTTLAEYAQSYAEQFRSSCTLTHSNGPYGENLYGGRVGAGGDNWFAADAVKAWVSEEQYYDYATNTCSSPVARPIQCEHYTQVVWRDTTSIGCARVVCDGNDGVFIICNYSPPGNVPGQRPY